MKSTQKTKIHAEENRQEIFITREFDIPLDLLFRAYTDPEIVAQWMNTEVQMLENKNHGSYRFVTTDVKGNQHGFNGTIHEIVTNEKIVRTFEMENASFPAQLEFLEFEKISDDTSKLRIHMILRSVEVRDQMLKLPFSFGINMAHDRLEEVVRQLTTSKH